MSKGTKLTDLNEYLFDQIKRLNDTSLTKEEVNTEIQKAQAITNIADTIIKNGELTLKTALIMQKMGGGKTSATLPAMLTTSQNDAGGTDEEEV